MCRAGCVARLAAGLRRNAHRRRDGKDSGKPPFHLVFHYTASILGKARARPSRASELNQPIQLFSHVGRGIVLIMRMGSGTDAHLSSGALSCDMNWIRITAVTRSMRSPVVPFVQPERAANVVSTAIDIHPLSDA